VLSRLIKWLGSVLISILALGLWFYRRDIKRAHRRVRSRGSVILSRQGDIEYTEGGSGPDVLVVHGSGGGYDQGELIAEAVLGERFHTITPSRFGYLRSALPDGATWDDQAHAYAYLLDHLAIDKVAVVAMSQGGPSALLFAALHPDRVSSLALISCGVVASTAEDQAAANSKGNMLRTIFQYDLLYWAIATLFKKQLLALIGAGEAVIASLTPAQQCIARRVIDWMNPAAPRSAGVAFDNRAPLPGDRIAAIEAPTLIFHATDDTLQLFHNAEFAASTIPNARLMRFERGGHLVIAVEQPTIQTMLREHIVEHVAGAASAQYEGSG